MKKRKKEKAPKKRLLPHFDIPEDIIFDVPRLTVFNNTELRIENYKSILEYEENKISLACKDKFINISGQKLNITIITDDEISIKGEILTIEFA